MAEIIKHGKYYGNKITCTHCGCVFIASPEDYVMSEKCIGGRKVVRCPECGKTISVYGSSKRDDWMNDEGTFKIHPEDDPVYKYYDIHVDKYDLSKHVNWEPDLKLPDDITDYISRVNSLDNYKLPDGLKEDCRLCLDRPCKGKIENCPGTIPTDGLYLDKPEIDWDALRELVSSWGDGKEGDGDD